MDRASFLKPGDQALLSRYQGTSIQARLEVLSAVLNSAFIVEQREYSGPLHNAIRKLNLKDELGKSCALPSLSIEEMCAGAKVGHKGQHLVVCPSCGQIFDCLDEAAVGHHKRPRHNAELKDGK